MIKIEHIETCNWEAAIRGMRNPKNSWSRSDSRFWVSQGGSGVLMPHEIGKNDLELMTTLAHAGSDHGKFLRAIIVSMDITAPLYWYKEFDTYKVGTVTNSCSTMHKIQAKQFTPDDFSLGHLDSASLYSVTETISLLNEYRSKFLKTKEKKYWWQMIQLLPSSYNQKRTVTLNYEVLRRIYHARKDHKLDEWRTLCADVIAKLPYAEELIITKE